MGWERGLSLRDLVGGEGTAFVVVEVKEEVVGEGSMAW